MRRHTAAIALASSLTLATACASAHAAGGPADAATGGYTPLRATPTASHSTAAASRVLGRAELDALPATATLWDAVVVGRAAQLGGRLAGAALYVDGQRYGDWSAMRAIRVGEVREVRLLSASEATAKYGSLRGRAGAIDVVTGVR